MATAARLDPDRAARVFHALSDPVRLRVLLQLRRGECCVCELCDITDVAQSRLSFHLKVLKEAGLLLDRKEGRWNYYAIDEHALDDAREVLELLAPMPGAAARCQC